MSTAQTETPPITSTRWDTLITGATVGIVAGIGIGVIAVGKNVNESIAAAAAGAGTGIAIAYFAADYQHTRRRHALATQHQIDRAQADAAIAQRDQELQQANLAVSELQAKLQSVQRDFDAFASAAESELNHLRSELATAAIAPTAEAAATPQDTPAPDLPPISAQLEPAEATA